MSLNFLSAVSCNVLLKLNCDPICEYSSNSANAFPVRVTISFQGDVSGLISNHATAAFVKHIVSLDTK